MKLFKAMKKKYYLNFFFLFPFEMGNLLLCYCILIAIVVKRSYTIINTHIWGNLKTQNVLKNPQR